MNKKALILPKFTVRLLISIFTVVLIAIAFTSCLNRYLRLSPQATESFHELTNTIEELVSDETLNKKLYSLVLDEETAIIGFTSEADAFKSNFKEGDEIKNYASFPKPIDSGPEGCDKDKACMCLCRKGLEITDEIPTEMSCKKLICKNFNNFEFNKKTELTEDRGHWENGFIIIRITGTKNLGMWVTGDMMGRERRSEIHIQKEKKDGKTIITVCGYKVCLLP